MERSFNTEKSTAPGQPIPKRWLVRIGWAGFIFFLLKGLAWIGVATFAGYHLASDA